MDAANNSSSHLVPDYNFRGEGLKVVNTNPSSKEIPSLISEPLQLSAGSVPTTSSKLQLPSSPRPAATQSTSHQTSLSHPVSPPPSSHSHHVSFLSWMSGRGSTSGQNCSKNSSVLFCRICHEGESSGERLISPCRCSGSVGLIHRSCIEKWLSTINHDTCELCKQKYIISRHPRPFSSWLCEPAVGDDQRNLVGDGVCFLLLTPLAGISAFLCASGAAFYFEQKKQSEAIGLICLSSLLVTIYIAWLVLTIRYHCLVWFKWRTNNQDIRLLDVSGQRPPATRTRADQREQLVTTTTDVFEDVETVVRENSGVTRAASHSSCSSVASQLSGLLTIAAHETDGHNSSHVFMADLATPLADQSQLYTTSRSTVVLANTSLQVEQTTDDEIPTSVKLTPPLSPNIISQDPQHHSQSKVVRSTADSEIYAQLPVTFCPAAKRKEILDNCSSSLAQTCTNRTQFQDQSTQFRTGLISRTVSAPYLPDLKEHFIALRSRQEPFSSKSFKSRGTFSPNTLSRNATFSSSQDRSSFSTSGQNFPVPSTFLPSSVQRYKSRPLPPIPGS